MMSSKTQAFYDLMNIVSSYNETYEDYLCQIKNSSEDVIESLKFKKWQFIKNYKTVIEQFIYDRIHELTSNDLELLDLVPHVVYRQLQEKTRIIIDNLYRHH